MAKRKLSAKQRSELRADLKKGPQAGESNADLLRRMAKKYGITTITARWYLKSIDGSLKQAGKRGRPAGRPLGSSSPDILLRKADEQLKRAKAAKKLAPRLTRLVAKEKKLSLLIKRASKRLEATSAKVVRIRTQMDALVS